MGSSELEVFQRIRGKKIQEPVASRGFLMLLVNALAMGCRYGSGIYEFFW